MSKLFECVDIFGAEYRFDLVYFSLRIVFPTVHEYEAIDEDDPEKQRNTPIIKMYLEESGLNPPDNFNNMPVKFSYADLKTRFAENWMETDMKAVLTFYKELKECQP